MTSDLASYLYELGTSGEVSEETRARLALIQAALVLEAGGDTQSTLARLHESLPEGPERRRVAECLAEIDHAAPAAPAPARLPPPVEAAPEPSFASIWVSPRSAHLHDTEDP